MRNKIVKLDYALLVPYAIPDGTEPDNFLMFQVHNYDETVSLIFITKDLLNDKLPGLDLTDPAPEYGARVCLEGVCDRDSHNFSRNRHIGLKAICVYELKVLAHSVPIPIRIQLIQQTITKQLVFSSDDERSPSSRRSSLSTEYFTAHSHFSDSGSPPPSPPPPVDYIQTSAAHLLMAHQHSLKPPGPPKEVRSVSHPARLEHVPWSTKPTRGEEAVYDAVSEPSSVEAVSEGSSKVAGAGQSRGGDEPESSAAAAARAKREKERATARESRKRKERAARKAESRKRKEKTDRKTGSRKGKEKATSETSSRKGKEKATPETESRKGKEKATPETESRKGKEKATSETGNEKATSETENEKVTPATEPKKEKEEPTLVTLVDASVPTQEVIKVEVTEDYTVAESSYAAAAARAADTPSTSSPTSASRKRKMSDRTEEEASMDDDESGLRRSTRLAVKKARYIK